MTGLFDKQYFDKWIGEKLYRKESFHLLAVDARNMKQINRIYGTRVGDQLLIRAAKGFREITDSVQIFRITGNCFLAVLDSLTDYEKARDGIEEKTVFYRKRKGVVPCCDLRDHECGKNGKRG